VARKSQIDRQRDHERAHFSGLVAHFYCIKWLWFCTSVWFISATPKPLLLSGSSDKILFSSENLGVSLVIVGIVVIALAAWRYNQVFWQIERGDYRPNRLMVWLIAAVVMSLGTLSIPLVLWRNEVPNPPSSAPSKRQSQNPLFLLRSKLGKTNFRFGLVLLVRVSYANAACLSGRRGTIGCVHQVG